ncbi:MAG: pyruvate dehydrogenase complex E1 component subunit beta [Myxococcales bacterium]|nr:pyruvate dehydrogenase complex E1 component subunit beta [Myxococcales bacterium]
MRLSYREALNQAMCEEMERDPNVLLLGEEVGHYQGAYKVSQGMLQKFGEKRVIDTPIAEAGFVGVGVGAAMVGLRPIVELMTFNFSLVAIDQIINNAAKIRQMSGGQFKVPMVIRGAGGAAHQLGAQHSQSLEAMFCHVPGLKVVMPSTPADAKGLLKTAIRDDDPVIFIEGELLYGNQGEVPEGEHPIPLGKGDIKRAGSDCTIVCWSKMVHLALAAAEVLAKEGISVEVVDPRTLKPLDTELIFSSVAKTHRCVIVEEGWPFSGVGAEIAHRIQHAVFDELDAPIERVTAMDVPMPYALHLEELVVPTAPKVVAAVRRALYLAAPTA